MIRYAAALLLSFCLFSPAGAANRALLIGIGTYATLPEKMFLEGPKNDVPLIEKLLKEWPQAAGKDLVKYSQS